MSNEIDPVEDNWYYHLDKGQCFRVVAIDEDNGLEVQHFDGDLEEISFDEWQQLDIELSEEPENWSGALDVGSLEDLGSSVTDTTRDDWIAPLREIRQEIPADAEHETEERQSDWAKVFPMKDN